MQSEMWLNHVLLVSLSSQEGKKEKPALASSFKKYIKAFTLVVEVRACHYTSNDLIHHERPLILYGSFSNNIFDFFTSRV